MSYAHYTHELYGFAIKSDAPCDKVREILKSEYSKDDAIVESIKDCKTWGELASMLDDDRFPADVASHCYMKTMVQNHDAILYGFPEDENGYFYIGVVPEWPWSGRAYSFADLLKTLNAVKEALGLSEDPNYQTVSYFG